MIDIPQNAWGFQFAHSGQGYAGLVLYAPFPPDYREYVEGQLSSPLMASSCYHFEMYINICNSCKFTTDAFGIYFTDSLISGITNYFPLPYIPQINNSIGNYLTDTSNWILFSGDYTAQGGEQYLLIGNFKPDSNSSIVLYDSLVSQSVCYIYIDDVSLTPCTGINDQNNNDKDVKVYPNPFSHSLTISLNNNQLEELLLFDITSRVVVQNKFINSTITTINTESLSKGIYICEVRTKESILRKKVIKE